MPLKLPENWGATEEELRRPYPCDALATGPVVGWYRALDVRADAGTTFRWLCQLRFAPYSYDLIDNFGRRSPRELTPGADRLTAGQTVMTIFELAGFAPDEHLTVRMRQGRRWFGDMSISYTVRPLGPRRSRLVVKLLVPTDHGLLTRRPLTKWALAWGDLFMMHRQLHTLAGLASRGADVESSKTSGE